MLQKRVRWAGWFFILLALAALLGQSGASQAAQAPLQDKLIYLPLVMNQTGYRGQVTYNGAPAAGQVITLRYWDGSKYTSWAAAVTDSGGNYAFTSLPPIGGGKDFYVRWTNDTQKTGYLSAWYCDNVTGTTADRYTCSFDIVDIDLVSPSGASSINLPYTFSWVRRPITRDSYQVEFLYFTDPETAVEKYLTPLLGYVSEWRMTSLPGEMTVGTLYYWGVRAYGANGYGESYYIRSVRFNDTSSPPLPNQAGPAGETARPLETGRETRPKP